MTIGPHSQPLPASFARCEDEQIHVPDAIQPHGALLAAGPDDATVTHASANLAAFLGVPATAALGAPLATLIGRAAWESILDRLRSAAPGAAASCTGRLEGPGGTRLRVRAHRHAHQLCLDIVRVEPEPDATIEAARGVLETFRVARTPSELCDLAVHGLRAVSGYDRVFAYRFGPEGDGEVVAEERDASLPPFLGLRYPAADIPAQARQHYLRQRVGSVADAGYVPVPVLAADPAAPSLDLTHSALRSVSPIHRRYMRNMRTAASLTVGLASRMQLWGMLVCHHATPRVAGPDLRAVADMVGTAVSVMLAGLADAEHEAMRQGHAATLRTLTDRLAAPVPLADALVAAEADLLHLVDAPGAAISLGGTIRCLGSTPRPTDIARILAVLQLGPDAGPVALDDLVLRHPALEACRAQGSGVLFLPLSTSGDDAILWFRPEQSRIVPWGGDPAAHAEGAMEPRTSFAAWQQVVTGRSAPWSTVDLALARDLRTAIEARMAVDLRTEVEQLRRFDRMVGQPNRQRELERSNAALEEFAYAASHDLKAPLRAIGHLADWIAEDIGPAASATTAENLRMLQGRVLRLQSLLDGLLAYARAARQSYPEAEAVDVAALVRDIAATLGAPAGFTIACAPGLPVLRTHLAPLQQVLSNLIVNAIMHHDRAEGRVEVAMRKQDDVAEFRIGDDGPGIPPRFQDRVFQIFQTLASRDAVEASGIGLAIVRKHVQAHGGSIWIESAPPRRGATFVFTWSETPP
ncbi:ATP-binding protein [Paracraurococcus ruber]|uniref:histidine kinase n=1 Tax=Paracraurococcus ruber TaxID=77675 RepID=A0ABS1CZI7_9PROT|nr:ATP-binding protein [Paracraurococcus ruber]MBK1659327.1 hypothetical protein [Paracraurococcus ruber]TDG29810.1 GAF domain-containing protein [Paracraurococcus ruber]